jgi:hypothetical protein
LMRYANWLPKTSFRRGVEVEFNCRVIVSLEPEQAAFFLDSGCYWDQRLL